MATIEARRTTRFETTTIGTVEVPDEVAEAVVAFIDDTIASATSARIGDVHVTEV